MKWALRIFYDNQSSQHLALVSAAHFWAGFKAYPHNIFLTNGQVFSLVPAMCHHIYIEKQIELVLEKFCPDDEPTSQDAGDFDV
jgi:hypothetical protein